MRKPPKPMEECAKKNPLELSQDGTELVADDTDTYMNDADKPVEITIPEAPCIENADKTIVIVKALPTKEHMEHGRKKKEIGFFEQSNCIIDGEVITSCTNIWQHTYTDCKFVEVEEKSDTKGQEPNIVKTILCMEENTYIMKPKDEVVQDLLSSPDVA